jgi:hypothetical protein
MPYWISTRQSIRWLESSPTAHEPTDTIVITDSQTGLFVDVRFLKGDGNVLDWGIAGHRISGKLLPLDVRVSFVLTWYCVVDGNKVTFTHTLDSHIAQYPLPSPLSEQCVNSTLPDGRIFEEGEMLNPATGRIERYEEIWIDAEVKSGIVEKNEKGDRWAAQAGEHKIAIGFDQGVFWAYQVKADIQQHATKLPDGVHWEQG